MRPHERCSIACVLALLLCACASSGTSAPTPRGKAAATPNQQAAQLQVRMGQGYLEKGDYEMALDKLQRALQLDPRSTDAHTVIAVLYERIKRPQLAETHHRKASEIAPDSGATRNNYGDFLCRTGRHAQGLENLERALADPFYRTPALALRNAGHCAVAAGDDSRAEGYFRRVLELERNDSEALIALVGVSYRKGEYLRARGFLQRFEAAGAVPTPELLMLASRVEDQLGDKRAAESYRERLRNHYPDYVPVEGAPKSSS